MKMQEKITFPWGKLIIVGTTKEVSVGIDIVFPDKEIDRPNTYLKKGVAIYYVIRGRGLCGGRLIKKGDLLKIKSGQKINLKNDFKKNLQVMTIYLPPYSEVNIGHK